MKTGELKPGGRVGEYVLKERIGEGLFGEVWKAVHETRNLTVALKIMKEDAASLVSEEQVFHRMTHDSIVRIVGGSLSHKPPYIAMEFIEGVSLRVYLKNKVLPVPVTLEIFREVVGGIEHAHAGGHIHGNLKPENILVTKAVRAKVCDFGFGRALAGRGMPGSRSSSGGIIGALDYMSPEQMRGEGADKRDDVYSLGRLLFEVLTGHVPAGIDETLTSQLDSSVAADFDAIYVRCCAERESRYEDAAGLLEDVSSIIENGHISLETARMAAKRRSEKRAPELALQNAVRDFVEDSGGRWDDEQWVEFLMSLYEKGLAAGWSQEQVAQLAKEIMKYEG